MQKALLLFAFISTSLLATAQTGSITGTITDAKTKEPIIGGSVLVQGTQLGTSTDIEGKFTITNLKPGSYSLQVSYVAYQTAVVPDVVVESTKITDITFEMQEEAGQLEEVVITGTRVTNTDLSIVRSIRESKLVVSGISAQQISKIPDADAAQVMKRVPGVTIVDNRFVMVRGVPERYNQVMINGAIAPSTEIDKRSFSFDLIPSGAVDQLLIYKSGTAEYPGDFAGGVIQIVTKQTEDEDYFKFGLSSGFRTGTSFNTFKESERSSTDFLGFDNGDRSLPANFPSTAELRNAPTIDPLRASAGQSLTNSYDYTNNNAPVDYGFNFGLSKGFDAGSARINTVLTMNYSTSYLTTDTKLYRFSTWDKNPETKSTIQYDFNDQAYSHDNKISIINNWTAKLSDRFRVEFKNLYVQIGDNKTIIREGTDVGSQPGLYRNYSYQYVSRGIYTGQLQADLRSKDNSASYKWMLGMNYINRNEPDFRRFRTRLDQDTDSYYMILPPSANLFDASRFYSELVDHGYSNGFNFEKKFGNLSEARNPTLKAGYLIDYKTRNFNARYFSYLYPSSFDGQHGLDFSYLPISQIFSNQNMYAVDGSGNVTREGFALFEGTDLNGKNSYEGKSLTGAGYVSGSIPLGKFDVSAGLRVEYFNQELSTYKGDSVISNKLTTPMPFLNIAYNLTEKSLIRAAYGRTVNRPEFRELAPFLFYQFEYNLNIEGFPDLKTATINNIDLRWEMYPSGNELISLGVFYKHFENPIEFSQVNASGGLQFSYRNAPEAMTYGLELEVRKSLASLSVNKILRKTSVNLNASLIKSEVDFNLPKSAQFQQSTRSLQGQSPYVINAGLYYDDTDESGFSFNVGYNIFGTRIFSAGSVLYPTWIERARNSMDIQVAKEFNNNMEVKLSVQNVFNAQYRLYQDNDENEKIDEKVDDKIQSYRTGTLFQLALNWKFAKN